MSGEKKKKIGYGLVLLVILLVIAVFIILISQKKVEYTSEDTGISKQEILICLAGENEVAFFRVPGATNIKHEVKVILNKKKPEKFFYMYSGVVENEERAEMEMTSLHANYDIYMGENNVSSKPTVNFSHVENEVRIDLYGKVDAINLATAKLFFLESERLSEILDKNGEELKEYYAVLGFSCEHQE